MVSDCIEIFQALKKLRKQNQAAYAQDASEAIDRLLARPDLITSMKARDGAACDVSAR